MYVYYVQGTLVIQRKCVRGGHQWPELFSSLSPFCASFEKRRAELQIPPQGAGMTTSSEACPDTEISD